MDHAPFYKVPAGSELILDHVRWRVVGKDSDGYAVEGLDDGEFTKFSFERVNEAIRLSDCEVITPKQSEKKKRLLAHTGGIAHVSQLSDDEQRDIRARLGLMKAMRELEDQGVKLTQRYLDLPDVRRKLDQRARNLMGAPNLFQGVYIGSARNPHAIPKGRTLQQMYHLYHEFDQEAVVLLRKHHRKGPQGEDRCRLTALQEHFIDLVIDAYQKTTQPQLATIFGDLEAHYLVNFPDVFPSDFKVPSITTVRNRVNQIDETAKQVARNGLKYAKNKYGAGSTSVRALMYGEMIATDQVYLSIFVNDRGEVRVRELSREEYDDKPAKNEIRRIWLHVMIDVATREVLAWVLAETPDADHQRSLTRMAMRDKTREKLRYGCKHDPAPPVGLSLVKSDNGAATRNADMYERLLGAGTAVQMNRAYESVDNTFAERLIGTLQFTVLNTLPGYAGSYPGELKGYDAEKAARLSIENLMGVLTRYFVDEYPHRPHRGTGMNKASPRMKRLACRAQYGEIKPPSPDERRIHLGERHVVTTTSEGVCVSGIWYNSPKLQEFTGGMPKKVLVCLDPDDLRIVTIFSQETNDVMTAQLRMVEFADMTLDEAIDSMVEAVEAFPEEKLIDQKRYREARARRVQEAGLAPNPRLPANYRTAEERQKMVESIANVEFIPMARSGPTVAPGSIMDSPVPTVSTTHCEEPKAIEAPVAHPAPLVPENPEVEAGSPEAQFPDEPTQTQTSKPMFAPITKSKL